MWQQLASKEARAGEDLVQLIRVVSFPSVFLPRQQIPAQPVAPSIALLLLLEEGNVDEVAGQLVLQVNSGKMCVLPTERGAQWFHFGNTVCAERAVDRASREAIRDNVFLRSTCFQINVEGTEAEKPAELAAGIL